MKLIKCHDGTRYANAAHIVSIYIEDAHESGRPLQGVSQVVANMIFGGGTEILYRGTMSECKRYIETL